MIINLSFNDAANLFPSWELVVALVSIISGTVISVWSIVNGNRNLKKNSFNNIVSTNRVEWMQKLKSLVSEYTSKIAFNELREFPVSESKLYDEIVKTSTAIKLHLNFHGKADKEIIGLIDEANKSFEQLLLLIKKSKSGEVVITKKVIANLDGSSEIHSKRLRQSESLLVILVQIYLKVEWERVKFEAGNDKIDKFDFDSKYLEYKKDCAIKIIGICNECEFDFIDVTNLEN